MHHNIGIVCIYCADERKEVRLKVASNGMKMVAAQCLTCGHVRSKWLSQSEIELDKLPPWNESLQDEWCRRSRVPTTQGTLL